MTTPHLSRTSGGHKRPTAKQRVLTALRQAGPHGLQTADLCQPTIGGRQFPARVMELRAEGHTITSEIVRQGSWKYILIREAEVSAGEAQPSPHAPLVTAGADLGTPGYHACDQCGYRFKTPEEPLPWPQGCPACKSGIHWITSFWTKTACEDYAALCELDAARLKNLRAAA